MIKGYISQIIGPVVDVCFQDMEQGEHLPAINEALVVQRDNGGRLILEVQQHIGQKTVRTVAMDSTDGLRRQMEVEALGEPISMPVGDQIKGRLMNVVGNDHLNIAFNPQPHDDHIMGFQQLPEDMPVDKFVIAFPEDENRPMRTTLKIIRERGIPIERVKNGSEMMLGDVRMVIMQKDFTSYTVNNRSAAMMVFYGDRRLLMAADIESHAQGSLNKKPPEFGLKADILKYPHHGVAKAGWKFLGNVDAELAIVTSKLSSIDETVADSEKRGLPLVSSVPGIVRLRTDGIIWVVDRIDP